ncbi:MAG: hypothetical protein A2X49_04760 [Lentisphaerae bacterium GWF2_52_8]|nr:MAG: hypothetical protein A2X49_04760 [Lentisphaerae bacterium GWF2_52_8]
MRMPGIIHISSLFTLIELLVVIAILSILLCLLLPGLKTAMNTSKKIACVSNQKQVYLAWIAYCTDYNGQLPVYSSTLWGDPSTNYRPWPVIMLDQLKPAVRKVEAGFQIKVPSFLRCPAFEENGYSIDTHYPAYGMYVYGIGGLTIVDSKRYTNISNIALPSQQIGFADSHIPWAPYIGYFYLDRDGSHFRHMEKANFSFCDGHIEAKDHSFTLVAWGWWNKAPWGTP